MPLIGLGHDYYTNWSIMGWSNDGYVALFEAHEYDMAGGPDGCRYRLMIQNMRTDEIVEELVLQDISSEWGEHAGEKQLEDSPNGCDSLFLVRHHSQDIQSLLNEYNIIRHYNNVFYEDSVVSDKYEIIFNSTDVVLTQKEIDQGEYNKECALWCGNRPMIYYLSIKDNNNNNSKILSRGADLCASEIKYVGFFKSPFENRILLVIYLKESDASETYYSTYRFIGCSLNPSTF